MVSQNALMSAARQTTTVPTQQRTVLTDQVCATPACSNNGGSTKRLAAHEKEIHIRHANGDTGTNYIRTRTLHQMICQCGRSPHKQSSTSGRWGKPSIAGRESARMKKRLLQDRSDIVADEAACCLKVTLHLRTV